MHTTSDRSISAQEFRRKFNSLILASWMLPPIVGLSFIYFIGILSFEQIAGILLTPLEPLYIIGWNAYVLWYFSRYIKKLELIIDQPDPAEQDRQAALEVIRGFPLRYWSLFLLYLVIAPATVIWTAEYYTDYVARPVDWFRIELTALIVSIIVGLPIFFKILDLFGRVLGNIRLTRPFITVKTKVFLIGALIPLLIDTILVQYFWTRTGFFTVETFLIWLILELLAIGASLIFVQSFAQSLVPLEGLFSGSRTGDERSTGHLVPASIDEIGVLTANYRSLLDDLHFSREVLRVRNRLLRKYGDVNTFAEVADAVIDFVDQTLDAEKAFLAMLDPEMQQLVCIAQTGNTYRREGYFQIGLDEVSIAGMTHNSKQTYAISDVPNDPRCSPVLRKRYQTRSALSCPLLVEGESIGVLMVTNSIDAHEYSEQEVALLEGIAAETALILHAQQLRVMHDAAMQQTREREQRISLLMDFTEEGIFGVDLSGHCTFINRAALRMLGYDREEEILGQSVHELIHHTRPDGSQYPKEECGVRVATLNGEPSHADDEWHWRRDGSSFPVEYWSHPLRKGDEVFGSVVTFVDITERLKAQQELRRSEQQLIEAQSIAHLGSWELDLDSGEAFWSDEEYRLLGYEPASAVASQESFLEAVHPDDRKLVESEMQQATHQDDGYYSVQHRICHPDGRICHVQEQGRVFFDAEGRPRRMIGTTLDVTERVEVEMELVRHQANLEQLVKQRTQKLEQQATIIDQIHDSVISTDMQGWVIGWNKGAERLFGYSAEEAIGQYISFLYPRSEHEFLQHEVIDKLQQQGKHEIEVLLRKKDGVQFFAHLSLSLIYDDTGQAVGMIGYCLDINNRKLAEQQLAQQAVELEASNKELEAFSYSVSHDLRAPLRAINGFSQALMEDYLDSLDDDGKDLLHRVVKATRRMGRLIDDLLKLSRVTRYGFNNETVDLSHLATTIVDRLQMQEPERIVEIDIQPGLQCMGDAHLLEIMLDNLIGNAWKYTSKLESARIEFGQTVSKDKSVFYVRDNGAGFDENYKDKMFMSFQRLHGDAEFEGSGIGLAIVQRVINRHRGHIWGESSKGQGATFYFTI